MILIPQQIGEDPSSTVALGINSRSVPYAMAALIIVCSLFLIFQSVVLKKDTVKELVLTQEGLALAYIACLIVSALLYKKSFILAVGFLGSATLGLLKCKKVFYYIIELAVVVALFYVFTRLLGTRLPAMFL